MSDSHELIVCFAATARAGLQPRLEHNLTAARIPWHFTPLTFPNPAIDAIRIGNRFNLLRELCVKFAQYKRLILLDAWDMLTVCGHDELCESVDAVTACNDFKVSLSAERNLWPDAYLEPVMPDLGSQWCFANGGFLAGTPDALSRWSRRIESQPHYHPNYIDQGYYNTLLLHRNPVVESVLDIHTELSYTMVKEGNELAYIQHPTLGLRPLNTLMETIPCALHFNGKYPYGYFVQLEASAQLSARASQKSPVTVEQASRLMADAGDTQRAAYLAQCEAAKNA